MQSGKKISGVVDPSERNEAWRAENGSPLLCWNMATFIFGRPREKDGGKSRPRDESSTRFPWQLYYEEVFKGLIVNAELLKRRLN